MKLSEQLLAMLPKEGEKMKDCNGKEIRVGCLLVGEDNYFRRVDYVGKERIITAGGSSDKTKARESEDLGNSWTQDDVNRYKLKIVEYKPLGVFDANGKEWHDQDEVMYYGRLCTAFHAVKSFKEDGNDFILVARPESYGGWVTLKSTNTIHSTTKEKTIDIDGKPFSIATIKEALKRYVE